MDRFATLSPGVGLTGLVMLMGYALKRAIDALAMPALGATPISPILIAILLGLALRQAVDIPAAYSPGVRWCARFMLRVGIVLLGLRLSLAAVGSIGMTALPLVVLCILAGLGFVLLVGRSIGLSLRLASLIAVGTGICGVSAIAATAPAIDAADDEVSYAIGCVTLFGMMALLSYPWLAHGLFAGQPESVGLFLGTAVHDTAQVTGAALLYSQWFDSPRVLEVATVTKLLRNLFIVAVVPAMTLLHRRRGAAGGGVVPGPRQAIPGFILLFIVMALVRTVGDLGERPFGIVSPDAWRRGLEWVEPITMTCLALAMAGVGLSTRLRDLRRLGWRPFALGFIAAGTVGVVSYFLIHALSLSL